MIQMMRDGQTTAVDLISAAFDLIEETDDNLKAWVWLDRDGALTRATELDELQRSGHRLGLLHGVPIGLKDIIDTAAMPTAYGVVALAHRQPNADAYLVSRLKASGAVIIGKTATTPFAFMDPAPTRNPHNREYGPGGSSAGSAAAVAAGHVPVAIGTQTNGSVIRPSSYCGIYGFKPSAGMISRTGVLHTSHTLDQVGAHANCLEDLALVSDVLVDSNPEDPNLFCVKHSNMLMAAQETPLAEHNFIWIEMPYFSKLTDDARAGMVKVIDMLGGLVKRMDAPASFDGLVDAQWTIQSYEIAHNFQPNRHHYGEMYGPKLTKLVDQGSAISNGTYHDAMRMRDDAISYFAMFFDDFDTILTPAAPGEAPLFSEGITGDPTFSTIWSLCGLPCLTLPLLTSQNSMPIGVQLVGGFGEDTKLMRTANWLLNHLSQKF